MQLNYVKNNVKKDKILSNADENNMQNFFFICETPT